MKKHKYKQDKLCIQKSDRKIFIPSYPTSWNESDAINACISGNIKFYFREVIKKKKWFWYYWEETGVIWKPKEGKDFTVINYKELKK